MGFPLKHPPWNDKLSWNANQENRFLNCYRYLSVSNSLTIFTAGMKVIGHVLQI